MTNPISAGQSVHRAQNPTVAQPCLRQRISSFWNTLTCRDASTVVRASGRSNSMRHTSSLNFREAAVPDNPLVQPVAERNYRIAARSAGPRLSSDRSSLDYMGFSDPSLGSSLMSPRNQDHSSARRWYPEMVGAGNPSTSRLDLREARFGSISSENTGFAARSAGPRLSSDRSSLDHMGFSDPSLGSSLMSPRNQDHSSARRWYPEMVGAGNPSTSAERLDYLARDPNLGVNLRVTVAENPSTSADTLNHLAEDLSKEVRAAVARHPNTGFDALCVLAADDESVVRAAVARNTKDVHLLSVLARDKEIVVKDAAGDNRLITLAVEIISLQEK